MRRKGKEDRQMPSVFLFGAEGEDGVDGGGSPRGQVAGKKGHGQKQQTRRQDGREVARRESEKHADDEPAGAHSGGDAHGDAEEG